LFGADAAAGNYGAFEGVGVAQETGSEIDAAGADEVADAGGGDDLAAAGDGRDDFDGEAELAAEVGEEGDVAGVLVAEAEVVADEDGAGAESVDQDAGDEVFRREMGEFESER
jgi:hypothetical protein